MSLSNKAADLLRFLEERLLNNRAAPSYDEMKAAIHLKTKSNMKRYLAELRDAGEIAMEDGKPRSIILLKAFSRVLRIPIGGSISAGQPIPPINRLDPAFETEHEHLTFTAAQFPKTDPRTLVAFKVDGDSMIDAHIRDGDWVILTTKFEKRPGDMLAFWLHDDQSLTLKHYATDGDYILLQPANPNYKTLRKHPDQVEAYGKVVRVERTYDA